MAHFGAGDEQFIERPFGFDAAVFEDDNPIGATQDGTAVRNGFVRHVPKAGGGLWESAISEAGTYQNGGYWGTPAGWYIAALARTDAEAARAMARDYVGFLRANVRADGLSEAWEWVNPETGKRNNPLYVATVALPYISLLWTQK